MSEIVDSNPSDIGLFTVIVGMLLIPLFAIGFIAGAAFFWLEAGWQVAIEDMSKN